ncbi:MAG: C25 family cysteine peptidase, partial [bacterium]
MKTIQSTSMVFMVLTLIAVGAFAAENGNERKAPGKALVLNLERSQWQALVAVSAVPAFYADGNSTPLILNDGSGKSEVTIPHDVAAVKDFGRDAITATAGLAKKYWTKAETVFVVSTYEQALWVVPSAALLSAPILVNPGSATLKALDVKKAIVVGGEVKLPVKDTVVLADKQAVWKYHLSALEARGRKGDYVIITNPHDTDDALNPAVQWPYLSLASAPLAAYRQALVQTGDYTGDRARLHALGVSLGDAGDKAKLEYVRPVFQKVKDDSYAAEKFLVDNGHTPKFLALVGGSIELPHYIIDLHTTYKYWNISIDYVPADTPYATLRNDVDYTRFVKPDLAVGRIMADTIQDASLQLVKTFFRKEYLPGGKYSALAPTGWEKNAVVFDGHRLNQPDEGGPDASPNEPFFPAKNVQDVFAGTGLKTDYVFPRDETKKDGQGKTAPELFESTSTYGTIQYIAHGDPPYMRVEAGRTGKDMKNYMATGPEFRKHLKFAAPTVAYVIGCNVGCVLAPFKSNDEFLPTSAIHAGAAAFLAPNKCQAICFWRYAPKGPGADQCVLFWENFLNKKLPIGLALNEAKWQGYLNWKDKQSEADRGKDSDNAIEVDAPSMVLFGDPALSLA